MAVNEVNRPLVILFGLLLILAVACVVAGEANASPCLTDNCPLPKVTKKLEAAPAKAVDVAERSVVRTRQCVKRCCPPKAKGIVRRVLGRVGR